MAQLRLHQAVAVNDTNAVRGLLQHAPSIDLLNARDAHMRTPLHVAVTNNSEQIVELLLANQDVDVNATALYDLSPLHLAARLARVPVVRLLFKEPRVKLDAVTDDYFTTFHLVAEGDDHNSIPHLTSKRVSIKDRCDVMRMLLAEQSRRGLSGCEDARDVLSRTPLHYAALHSGCIKMMEALSSSFSLDKPSDSSSDDMEAPSPSHVSTPTPSLDTEVPSSSHISAPTSSSSETAVPSSSHVSARPETAVPSSSLRDMKSANILDVNGLAPLHILIIRGNKEAIKLLIRMPSADINVKTSTTKLHSEVAMVPFGNNAAPRCLFPFTDVQWPTELMSINRTPLHFAAKLGNLDILELLLTKEDIKINDIDDEGLTPFFQSEKWSSTGCGVAFTESARYPRTNSEATTDRSACYPSTNSQAATDRSRIA